jgi:hypothetical protein
VATTAIEEELSIVMMMSPFVSIPSQSDLLPSSLILLPVGEEKESWKTSPLETGIREMRNNPPFLLFEEN